MTVALRYPGARGSTIPLAVVCAALLWAPAATVSGQSLAADPFATQVVGTWVGSGTDEANTGAVTRTWALDVGARTLRVDRGVQADSSVAGVQFWRAAGTGVYDVLWHDDAGRRQTFRATRDPVTGQVSATYLDARAEGGPALRTWEVQGLGPNAYAERLYRGQGAARELLSVVYFRRLR